MLDFFDFLEFFRLIHSMDYLISTFPHPRMDGLPFTFLMHFVRIVLKCGL